jgi:hypothetical protein
MTKVSAQTGVLTFVFSPFVAAATACTNYYYSCPSGITLKKIGC